MLVVLVDVSNYAFVHSFPHLPSTEPKYGVVSQMPLVGSLEAQNINVANNMTYLTNRTNESAEVGYFRTTFDTGVTTEVSHVFLYFYELTQKCLYS